MSSAHRCLPALLLLSAASLCHADAALERAVSALWSAMSHEAGTGADTGTLRRLFHAEAVVFGARHDGKPPVRHSAAADFLQRLERVGEQDFFECEIQREIHASGRFATVYSVVESRRDRGAAAEFTGVNSLQLFRDEDGWKVLSLYYYVDAPDVAIASSGRSGHCIP